jgi:hypothetical protein
MQNDDGEVLRGGKKMAAELSRLLDEPIDPQKAIRWAVNGTIPARKAGVFWCTTKAALRDHFRPKNAA